VVEHPLGKGEVVSSILTGSTNKIGVCQLAPLQNRAEQNAKRRTNTHQIRTICSLHVQSRREQRRPLDPENRSLSVGEHEASKNIHRLTGTIKNLDTAASGSKPQRFCSSKCRELVPATEMLPLPAFEAARGHDFDWAAEAREGGSVVLRQQRMTAVYRNTAGDLVIRQERDWNEEEDPFVVITQQNEQEFWIDFLGIRSCP
jgi:hypothetical protein